jgi:putative aldouronate transport system permease protein
MATPKVEQTKTTYRSRLNRWTVFDYANALILFGVVFVTVYPIWNVTMLSLNDPFDSLRGGITFIFRQFTLGNFVYFFEQRNFLNSCLVSVGRTVVGTMCSVLVTGMYAFGMSKRNLIFRKFFSSYMMIPLYFNGGLIPTFLLVRSIGLYQNFFVYVVLYLFSTYNCIIMMTYFKGIPAELEESTKIDGGSDLTVFFRIIVPVSMPVVATIALFNGVFQWNSWFDTFLYGGAKLMTLQATLVEIIRNADIVRKLATQGASSTAQAMISRGYKPTVETVKATAMVIAAAPIIMVYPFLQRYFVKGIMIGSIKG